MTSKAADVATYLEEIPAERRAAFETLRALCRQHLIGYEECMEYGMPGYKRNGSLELSFASQKQYIALYVKPTVVNEFRATLGAANIGKSCIRFRKPEEIDFTTIAKLLRRTEATPACSC
ncbi:MAG TPA: DUF1801 domain-containing protein [Bryobacteraceae bacterium]|jgi:uncharacterized protein YdhG (YjbR/CyaY superfamily)|nr:DUF1801 domain-containing protein [Bryobacteraceae bacterium]